MTRALKAASRALGGQRANKIFKAKRVRWTALGRFGQAVRKAFRDIKGALAWHDMRIPKALRGPRGNKARLGLKEPMILLDFKGRMVPLALPARKTRR